MKLASNGLKTNRDVWVIDSSLSSLQKRVQQQIAFFNSQIHKQGAPTRDPKQFKWDANTLRLVAQGQPIHADDAGFRVMAYRPFFKQWVYFNDALNNSWFRLPRIFPDEDNGNSAIVVESKLRTPGRMLGVMAVDVVPEVASTAGAAGQASIVFPRYIYDSEEDTDQGRLGTADGIDVRV